MRIPNLLLALGLCAPFAAAQSSSNHGVVGDWREPGGSVIEVLPCGKDVCARLIKVVADVPNPTDKNNPNAALRSRPACGLQIGYGFHLNDPAHADGGKLYDPKSGKTYKGAMTAEGDQLHLRGYVGIKAFGRTETWTRATGKVASCPIQPAA